ncbi:PP2C family protein-serine/threonine phosphatase [Thiomicrorhabdus lithotrophica]|uniref:Fused response regulator/phosphatase n=1 Tax=Thiomicrorhabdus lithotrophica TaxID=2949997 RepID=A0ABY8CEA4_9GAMM|nr:fused response regulator/phosphatase [Thiomicrorhabdus lithotrophica]WEJ63572.1 fused response regulator/phosphatase [Thiomicrorhabdus lithotrophica]
MEYKMLLPNILSSKPPYILVVDDEQMNRFVLEDIIEDRYELVAVANGQACLDSVEQRVPDLILLDINMPGISGYDVCTILKSKPQTNNVPIIFLTAMMKAEDEKKGLHIGAVDYITKPFTESILLARIKTHIELNFTRKMLERSNQLLRQERDYIEQIIGSMRQDERFDTSNLQTLISPLEKSSGDIVLSACTENNHQHILIGDFTGHGLNAAIAGPLISSLFYTRAQGNSSARDVLQLINDELFQKLPTQCFLAATYVDWDKSSEVITIWNFGMPASIIYNQKEMIGRGDSIGVALGIVACCDYDVTPITLPFRQGDKLYCYTDGMDEVVNANNEQFGEKRVLETLQEINYKALPLELLLERVLTFSGGAEMKDDATLIELSCSY